MAGSRFKVRDVETGQMMSARAFKAVTRSEIERSYFPLSKAAKTLNMSTKRLRGWCEQNDIPYIKSRGRWWVHKGDLIAFLSQH